MTEQQEYRPHLFKLESAPSARSVLSSRSLMSATSTWSSQSSFAEGDASPPSTNCTIPNSSNNLRRQVSRSQSTTAILTVSEPGEGRRGRLTFTTSTENLKRAGSSRGMRTSLSSTDEFSSTLPRPLLLPPEVASAIEDE